MLVIGPITLDFPVVQAPLSGYSDLAMRRAARLHGAEWTFDEVKLDRLVLAPGKHRRRILRVEPDDHPLGGQLMGSDPDEMARAASAMVEAGYEWIDVNFACPVRKVLGRGRGGRLMRRVDVALAILRSVHDAVAGRCPVTVKLRRGWDDSPESERRFFEILDGAFEITLDGAIVHPRTVKQRYTGRSDWTFLARVKKHVGGRAILGSGDLYCAEDVVRMLEHTGVDGVTLARGCIGNPWIFQECRALLEHRPLPPTPDVPEQGRTIARHLAWAMDLHGERRGSRIMRKFAIKYSELHPSASEVREAFIGIQRAPQWREVIDTWYDPAKPWPPGQRRTGPGEPIAAGTEED
ncbi:MAG: tRNA-dihydrouridine synthase [Phycisphaerae bacterium]|nr:tRNA-dihydrouridine synthase [Phycisphaerae bacterium]